MTQDPTSANDGEASDALHMDVVQEALLPESTDEPDDDGGDERAD